LFAQTTIVTLSDLSELSETHKKRADASRVKLIGRSDFETDLYSALKKI